MDGDVLGPGGRCPNKFIHASRTGILTGSQTHDVLLPTMTTSSQTTFPLVQERVAPRLKMASIYFPSGLLEEFRQHVAKRDNKQVAVISILRRDARCRCVSHIMFRMNDEGKKDDLSTWRL